MIRNLTFLRIRVESVDQLSNLYDEGPSYCRIRFVGSTNYDSPNVT